MSGILSEIKKLNKGEVSVGIDFSGEYSQISYSTVGSDAVETVPMISGTTSYLIPTVLFKRGEVNQWYIGQEALDQADDTGLLIKNLVELAEKGEPVTAGEEEYLPAQLVALYLRRILSMASLSFSINKVNSLMISVENLSVTMVETLREAVRILGLKTSNVYFQNHMESFYYYSIYSPEDLWRRNVLLYDFSGNNIRSYMLECNNRTTPIVAYIQDMIYETVDLSMIKNPDITDRDKLKLDNAFHIICEESTRDHIISSIYLIGDNFNQDIFKESVRFLCKRGRVFGGNNLYSKGACYSAIDKKVHNEASESHVFLGNEKLKSNIGINAYKYGKQVYVPLLDAGVNWFETKVECELILDKEPRLDFVITPLTGKNPRVHEMILSDFPKRPERASRIRLSMSMISEDKVEIKVTDMGFGEIFPASDTEWSEVIEL